MSRRILPASFYARPTLTVIADIIGKVLVHDTRGRRTAGVIVEAEAYIGETDPACHAAPGRTRRNAPLYGPPGRSYVYLNYGIHNLFNAVTEGENAPAAILIRALEPVDGVDLMRRRRVRARKPAPSAVADADLCRGPGNLTMAMGIDLADNDRDLTRGPLRIEDRGIQPASVAWSPRVGIRVATDRLWRCTWEGNACVSASRSSLSRSDAGRSGRSRS